MPPTPDQRLGTVPDRELLALVGGVVVVGLVLGAQGVPDGVTVVEAPALAVGSVEDGTGGTLVPLVRGAGTVSVGVGVNVGQAEGLAEPDLLTGAVDDGLVSTGVVEAGVVRTGVVRTGVVRTGVVRIGVVGAEAVGIVGVERGEAGVAVGVGDAVLVVTDRDDWTAVVSAGEPALFDPLTDVEAGADDAAGADGVAEGDEVAGVVRLAASAPASVLDGAGAEDEWAGYVIGIRLTDDSGAPPAYAAA